MPLRVRHIFAFTVSLVLALSPIAQEAKGQTSAQPGNEESFHTLRSPSEELNTLLMHTTFRIQGQKRDDPTKFSFGTVFFMGIPIPDEPKKSKAILITAAHVLDGIADNAALVLRRVAQNGTYQEFPYNIRIRENGTPLYVKHDTADVAAMYITGDFPSDVPITLLNIEALVDDDRIRKIDLHPGDEVFCLGFPIAAAAPGGFPILRTGHIASYPVTPMKTVGMIDLDLLVFPGNSGGPVYFVYPNRVYGGTMHLGGSEQGVLGLVVQNITSAFPEFRGQSLQFGAIVPAAFIRETIEKLPPVK